MYMQDAYIGVPNTYREEGGMTDDRRHTETEVESRAMLAALYRVLEDARRYEEYAEVAQWAYDEELLDFFRELQEESRGQAEKLLAQRLADGGDTSQPIQLCAGRAQF
jgi:tRNA isopentenyl-2-thiomethyl-A-37 hydroxylase MiaE